jgi:sulfite reductase beta subunit-like hemoprotein
VVVRIGAGDGGWVDLGFALAEDQVVQATAALAETYLELLPPDGSKPRLRYLLAVLDQHALQERLLQQAPALTVGGDTLPPIASAPTSAPVGVHAQTGDDDLTYVGLVPFVAGRLSSAHLRLLAALAERSASGSLRLSPWRNVLVPGVPRASVEAVQADLEAAGLSCRAPSLASGIVACAGSAGCASGFVDTVRDALALSARLNGVAPAAEPLNIHLSGCAKYCAQRRQADVTLLGRAGDGGRYDLFVRSEGDARPGRLVAEALAPADALAAVERLVKVSS